MNGVTICEGAIVSVGAVVTKNVAAYSIVGGVPSNEVYSNSHVKKRRFYLQ